MQDRESGLTFFVDGEVGTVVGRNASIKTTASLEGRLITAITTQGPDGPTNAERARSLAVLEALQGQSDLFANPFLKYIFNQPDDSNPEPFAWPDTFPTVDVPPPVVTSRPLNDSQDRAVKHMLMQNNDSRLTIIQGPPGTGT